ncbi:MAG: PilN domain-containing protein [Candidatus Omnitrophica bacterium]|nr:PilN domain-containing protein [Candidatus Omnitrophota bacterium]
MDRVNLLPDEARLSIGERLTMEVDREFPRILATIVGSILFLGVSSAALDSILLHGAKRKLRLLDKETQTLRVEIQNAEVFSKQIDQIGQELDRQKKFIDWKIAYLKEAKNRPRIWATVLKELRRNIPHGVWLTELETGTGGGLRITGGAPDEALVTQFMANLKESPHFSSVGFNYTEKDNIGSTSIVKFEILCRLH